MGPLATIAFFALIVTKITDTIRNGFDPSAKAPKVVWNTIAFAIGVGVCLIWHINILTVANVPPSTAVQGLGGEILTGILFGSGSSAWHELLDWKNTRSKGK